MTPPSGTQASSRPFVRKLAAVALGAVVLLGATSGTASAKGGGATPVAANGACSPVSSMKYKGDTSTADSNVATIDVSYAVKPCDKRPVRVEARLALSAPPSAVAYLDANAVLSGRFTVSGVKANTSYTATITVYDAATNAVVGTRSIFAAAVYQGV